MTRPNIVWIMTDHLLYAHHQRLTGYPKLPAYDRLAQEGIHFENAFSCTPLCGPVRASMVTGTYPHRHGMLMNDGQCGVLADFAPDQKLMNRPLLDSGYKTAFFGKWHAGMERTAQDYGFEGFSMSGYGHPYYADRYLAYLKEFDLPEPTVTLDWSFTEPDMVGETISLVDDFEKPYGAPYRHMQCSGRLNAPVETHESYFLTHIASEWVRENADASEPFFMRLDPWGPHHPHFVAEPFINTIDPAIFTQYPSFDNDLAHRPQKHRDLLAQRIEQGRSDNWGDWQPVFARANEHAIQVDTAICLFLDTLEALNLLDNTLIIYTTDHGGALGSNGGLVDKGWVLSDETVRIPMAMRWPEKIQPATSTKHFVSNLDLVPTVLAAAGADFPTPLDGTDLAPLFSSPNTTDWREDIMLEHHGHYGQKHFQRQIRHGHFKYSAHLGDRHELYDLSTDLFELDNLIDDHTFSTVRDDLRHRLVRQMKEHDDHSDEALALIEELKHG